MTFASNGTAWLEYFGGAGAALDLSVNGGANVNTAPVSKIDASATSARFS